MIDRRYAISRRIQSFVDNPITNLVKGVILVLIGLSDVSHTFRDDFAHGKVRLGHGLILLGIFSVLGALPHLIDGLAAGDRFVELRQKRAKEERK